METKELETTFVGFVVVSFLLLSVLLWAMPSVVKASWEARERARKMTCTNTLRHS